MTAKYPSLQYHESSYWEVNFRFITEPQSQTHDLNEIHTALDFEREG